MNLKRKRVIAKSEKIAILLFFVILVAAVLSVVLFRPSKRELTPWGAEMEVVTDDGKRLSARVTDLVRCEDGSFLALDGALHVIWRVTEEKSEIVCGEVGAVSPTGTVEGGYRDGAADEARFHSPSAILAYEKGFLISDTNNHVLRYYDPEQNSVVTFAGTGAIGQTDGTLDKATFAAPSGLALDDTGDLFVCDTLNHAVRKIDAAGYVSTFLGGEEGFQDGSFDVARLSYPTDVAVLDGELYLADRENGALRAVKTGELVTVCGNLPQDSGEHAPFVPDTLFSDGERLLIASFASGCVYAWDGDALSVLYGGDDVFLVNAVYRDRTGIFFASADSDTLEVLLS